MDDDARKTLIALVASSGESLAELSRMLRRNAAYLQQYLHRRTPRRLSDEDRRLLAAHFGVAEAVLGGPGAPVDTVALPYLAVTAAAGAGRVPGEEAMIRAETFALATLRRAGVDPAHAGLIAAAGDSMAPGILDGDRLLVDRADTRLDRHGRVFVARHDDLLIVKRLARDGAAIAVRSDNPDYPAWTADRQALTVIGRVRLLLREPG